MTNRRHSIIIRNEEFLRTVQLQTVVYIRAKSTAAASTEDVSGRSGWMDEHV